MNIDFGGLIVGLLVGFIIGLIFLSILTLVFYWLWSTTMPDDVITKYPNKCRL